METGKCIKVLESLKIRLEGRKPNEWLKKKGSDVYCRFESCGTKMNLTDIILRNDKYLIIVATCPNCKNEKLMIFI